MTGVFLGSIFYRQGLTRNTVTTTAIAMSLTVSPELVKMWNLNGGPFFTQRRSSATEKIVLQVDGIACESCASNVKKAILSI